MEEENFEIVEEEHEITTLLSYCYDCGMIYDETGEEPEELDVTLQEIKEFISSIKRRKKD